MPCSLASVSRLIWYGVSSSKCIFLLWILKRVFPSSLTPLLLFSVQSCTSGFRVNMNLSSPGLTVNFYLCIHSEGLLCLRQEKKKKKSQNLPSSAFHSTQTLSRWDDTRPHWREKSTVPGPLIQTLISSVNTHRLPSGTTFLLLKGSFSRYVAIELLGIVIIKIFTSREKLWYLCSISNKSYCWHMSYIIFSKLN